MLIFFSVKFETEPPHLYCLKTIVLLLSLFLNYQYNSGFNCSDIGMYVLLNWSMVAGYEELPRGFLARYKQRNILNEQLDRDINNIPEFYYFC